jgi:Transposase DDE domain
LSTSPNLRSGQRYAFPTFRAILMCLTVNVPVVGARRLVMPFKFHRNGRHHIPRQKFRVTNWRDYEAALRNRGSLTIWFTTEAIADWRAQPRATPGGQRHYSDLAIETALIAVKALNRMRELGQAQFIRLA